MAVTADDLLKFLGDELGVDTGDVSVSTPLFSSGVIDSFALVQLITYIEDRCGFRISAIDVSLENLDSVDRILGFIDRAAT